MLRSATRYRSPPPTIRVVTPPAALLTPTEVRERVGLPAGTPSDTALSAFVEAAVEQAELYTRRAFATQTIEVVYDLFPRREDPRVPALPWWLSPGFAQGFEIPRPPLQSVTSVEVRDYAGAATTVSPSVYLVNDRTEPGSIVPTQGSQWPTEILPEGGVVVTIQAGYGAPADVPEGIRTAVALQAAYAVRDAEGIQSESIDNASVTYLAGQRTASGGVDAGSGLVKAAHALLAPYRIAML